MTPAALLLDLDGTLIDSEPLNRATYRAFIEARGWAMPDLSLFTGRRAQDVFATEPGPWAGEDPLALAAEVAAQLDPDAVPTPLPGAAALLAAADQLGIPVAIVTSAGPEWVRRSAVGELAALAEVELVVTADDVIDGKPDPTGYDLACRRLDIPAGSALAVEDSPAGVRAATAAGIGHVVAVTTTHDAAALTSAGADTAVSDLLAVVDLLD
jgi:HAD superfamily hydrolase (TIGR01509 family)